ncbi:MAG TPA: glycosyltransferase family 39 protein [Myxococcota bacterium]|nr:glycosyltransferase family 39 protein [Myxococcota bacterium]HQK49673.1 glycosyltransferase family 39 protein [Myxococcota bacterium]
MRRGNVFWIVLVLTGVALPLGIWGPGLWDPWEMNQAFVARRMAEAPRVLVASGSAATGVQALQAALGDEVVPEAVGGAAGSLEGIRPRLSEKVFEAVVLDLDGAVTGEGDTRGLDSLARLLSSLVTNNRSTTFLLVSGAGKVSPAAVREALVARVEETGDDDAPVEVLASRTVAVADPASLPGAIRDSVRGHSMVAQFKAQGQTRFVPPLEPWFTSLSLRAFGLTEFAARLPSATMAVLLVLILGLAVRQAHGDRTGILLLVALASSPALLLAARTVSGMTATVLWMTLGGLATARIARGDRGLLPWAGIGVAAILSWLSGGMFALVTLAAAVILLPVVTLSRDRRLWAVAGSVAILAGVLALLTFLPEASFFRQMRFTRALWSSGLKDEARNFDLAFRWIGFGLFPWSALLPLAVVAAVQGVRQGREDRLVALLFAAAPWLAMALGVRPFQQVGIAWVPGALVLVVLYLQDLEDDPLESRLLAFVSLGLFLVMWKDLSRSVQPLADLLATDPPFSAPGKGDLAFPEGLALPVLGKAFALLSGLALLVHGGRLVGAVRTLPAVLSRGRTFRVLMILMAGLIVADLAIFLALKWPALVSGDEDVQRGAILLRVFLTGPDILALYLLTLALVVARYGESLYRWKAGILGEARMERMARGVLALETPRAFGVWIAVASAGLAVVLAAWVVPTLSWHLSQKHLLQTWQESSARAPGDLFRHGVFSAKGTEDSNFYTSQVPELSTRAQLLDRLKDASRRTAVLLPKNQWSEILSAFRAANGGRFLPLLDDRSSRYVLAASSLAPGDQDRNWLAAITTDFPTFEALPGVQRTSVNFDDRIEVVGWSVDPPAVRRGGTAVLRTWFRVLNKVDASYRIFLHVDRVGSSSRIHGDHWVANLARETEDQTSCVGCYATTHWLKGDVVMDRYEIDIPIGSPSGPYDIWMGFYNPSGEKRLPVKAFDKEKVRHDGQNRVRLGSLTVE